METERKVSRMFSLEERSRAVELYLTTPMTTAQVAECLGYPTRQCLDEVPRLKVSAKLWLVPHQK